jgi:hypothetical protein
MENVITEQNPMETKFFQKEFSNIHKRIYNGKKFTLIELDNGWILLSVHSHRHTYMFNVNVDEKYTFQNILMKELEDEEN